MVASVTVMTVWLLIYNHLWDRPGDHHTPAEAVIYNVSTAVTLLLGVACMYGLLYVSALIVGPGYLESQLHHRIGYGDYAAVVWLASSIGVVAGALGSSLDGEEAVRKRPPTAAGNENVRNGTAWPPPAPSTVGI
jgi:hypothetical protein